jgi:hypothetical protein
VHVPASWEGRSVVGAVPLTDGGVRCAADYYTTGGCYVGVAPLGQSANTWEPFDATFAPSESVVTVYINQEGTTHPAVMNGLAVLQRIGTFVFLLRPPSCRLSLLSSRPSPSNRLAAHPRLPSPCEHCVSTAICARASSPSLHRSAVRRAGTAPQWGGRQLHQIAPTGDTGAQPAPQRLSGTQRARSGTRGYRLLLRCTLKVPFATHSNTLRVPFATPMYSQGTVCYSLRCALRVPFATHSNVAVITRTPRVCTGWV